MERYERLFKNTLGKYNLEAFNPLIAQEIVNQLAEKYKSYRTYVQVLSPIFDYGVLLQVCNYNPFKMVQYPRKDPRTLHEKKPVLTKEELMIFLYSCNTISPFYYAYFSTLAFTGMRASECCALTWKDIHFRNATIDINKTTVYNRQTKTTEIEDTTKTDVFRTVAIPKSLVNVLKQWKKIQHPKSQYLFERNDKLYSSAQVNRWIVTIKKVLPKNLQKKKITSHIFRRTHSQLLLEAGVPLTYISKRLGHTRIMTTDTFYLRNTKELEKQALDKLDSYLHKIK